MPVSRGSLLALLSLLPAARSSDSCGGESRCSPRDFALVQRGTRLTINGASPAEDPSTAVHLTLAELLQARDGGGAHAALSPDIPALAATQTEASTLAASSLVASPLAAPPPAPQAAAPFFGQQPASMLQQAGQLTVEQQASVSDAATALERAAVQITELQAQLTRQERVAFAAEQRATRQQESLLKAQQQLQQFGASAQVLRHELEQEQQQKAVREEAMKADYEQRLRELVKQVESADQHRQLAEQRQRQLQKELQSSEEKAKELGLALEEQKSVSKSREDWSELALQQSVEERKSALKALKERNLLLLSRQSLLEKGEAQLSHASEQLQAANEEIAHLQSQLSEQAEAVSSAESKRSESAQLLSKSEEGRLEAERQLQLLSLEDAQKLNASEARLREEEQRLRALLHLERAQKSARAAAEARLNSSLAMNRQLKAQLAASSLEATAGRSSLAACEDLCFTLANEAACCAGRMADLPKACLSAAQVAAGQALPPPSCLTASPAITANAITASRALPPAPSALLQEATAEIASPELHTPGVEAALLALQQPLAGGPQAWVA